MSAPLIYLVLGPTGAGRRAVVADLVENGLEAADRAVLFTFKDELPAPDAVAEHLGRLPNLVRDTWELDADGRLSASIGPGSTHVFLVADGRADPAGQVEAVRDWLLAQKAAIARVITVVDCALGHAHPELQAWHDACIHFSDIVLLGRRSGAPNAWVSDFAARLRKAHLPCLVELVKKDGVDNPALVLDPQARRISTVFDAPDEWAGLEEDDEQTGELDAGEAAAGKEDPYLEKYPSGHRMKALPDIRKFLGQEGEETRV
ncbi:MAG: hypothetical protein ACREIA_25210 [Opitutaceae bacterium]